MSYYDKYLKQLQATLTDLRILAGDEMGPSDASWQDVAGTAAVNLKHLAHLIDQARNGKIPGPVTFASPDAMEEE